MKPVLHLLASIFCSSGGKKYSLVGLVSFTMMVFGFSLIAKYFPNSINTGTSSVVLWQSGFFISGILCGIILISYIAFLLVEKELVGMNNLEIRADTEKLERLKNQFEKYHSSNQEQRVLLILEAYHGTCRVENLKEIYRMIFGSNIESSVFYGLKAKGKPVNSELRRHRRLPPFIDYSIGRNVSLTAEGRKYLRENPL